MADLSTLARPYAKAVFELAGESGKLQDWSAQLAAIAEAVANPQLSQLIGHPALTKPDLVEIFGKALSKQLNAQSQSFLRLLIENGRLRSAGFIAEQYEQLRAEAESRVDVEITSAVDVAKAQQDSLTAAIKQRLHRDVAVQWNTDAALVAGAIIRAGDLVIDGSVRGELERLQVALAR